MRLEFVNIGRVKADAGEHLRVETATEIEVPTDADSHRPKLSSALRMGTQAGDHRSGVIVIGLERLVDLAPVSAVCARAVVGKYAPCGFVLVKNFRRCNDVTVACEQRGVGRRIETAGCALSHLPDRH